MQTVLNVSQSSDNSNDLALIHQSQDLFRQTGRPHLLGKANGRKCDYDKSNISDTGCCLSGLTTEGISFQFSNAEGETKYLMWAHGGIMGIFFGYVGKLSFLTRTLWGLIQSRNTFEHTVSMQPTPSPPSPPDTLILTHSFIHTQRSCLCSQFLKGEGNCCGSRATERQSSVRLIGISGQRNVEFMESEEERLYNLKNRTQQFHLSLL